MSDSNHKLVTQPRYSVSSVYCCVYVRFVFILLACSMQAHLSGDCSLPNL